MAEVGGTPEGTHGVVVVFATPLLPFPLRRLESLTAAISVSFDLLFLAPLAEVHL